MWHGSWFLGCVRDLWGWLTNHRVPRGSAWKPSKVLLDTHRKKTPRSAGWRPGVIIMWVHCLRPRSQTEQLAGSELWTEHHPGSV